MRKKLRFLISMVFLLLGGIVHQALAQQDCPPPDSSEESNFFKDMRKMIKRVVEGKSKPTKEKSTASPLVNSEKKAGKIAQLEGHNQSFEVNRNLEKYLSFFKFMGTSTSESPFQKKLNELNQDSHWIDMGGGNGLAVKEFLNGKTEEQGVPEVTLISYEYDDEKIPLKKEHKDRYHVINKKMYPQDVSSKDLKKADLITDIFGIFQYMNSDQERLDTIKDYIKILKPDGIICLRAHSLNQSLFDELKNDHPHMVIHGKIGNACLENFGTKK